MESIGKCIGKLRQAAGITQEKLGNALGVTTQAVSRWECGGTPDAALLPAIADFFHVSIDELFGREGRKAGEKLEDRIREEIAACPEDRRYERAFELCLGVRNGILSAGGIRGKNLSLITQYDNSDTDGDGLDAVHTYSSILEKNGMLWVKMMREDKYFFMMPEPKSGFGSVISQPEEYEKLFECLGRPGCMTVLIYIYQNNYEESPGFSVQWAAQGAGLPEEQTGELLQQLTEIDLLSCRKIRIDKHRNMDVYSLKKNNSICVFLMLLSAQMCIHWPSAFIPLWDLRKRPILAEKDTI